MKTKHTPGPWRAMPFWGDAMTGKPGITIYGPDGNDKRISEIVFSGFRTEEEHEANARLIAAAPDLLAASKKFLAFYEDLAENNNTFMRELALHDYERWEQAREELPAAIAKAEGKA